jgi:integrase/recombinase XerD
MELQLAPIRTVWREVTALREAPSLDQQRRDPEIWHRAAAAWLDSKASPHTRRTYHAAVQAFFAHCCKEPWDVAGADVIAWLNHLQDRGRSAATINVKLAALRSFYHYCEQQYTILDPATGRERPLARFNPALRAERAKVTPYGKSTHLNATEVKSLLLAVDRSTPTGLRDYALILAYVYTGRRSSEIRTIRWGDISVAGDRAYYRWSGKGGKQREDELPWPVYHAITDYLQASAEIRGRGDRWEPEDDEFIFVPLSNVASRLPCVQRSRNYTKKASRIGRRPLSRAGVNRIVKRQARRAGLGGESGRRRRITTHTLRHTAAMLRRQLTDDVQEIQRFLDHSSLSTTQIYLEHTEKRRDNLWMRVEALIGGD